MAKLLRNMARVEISRNIFILSNERDALRFKLNTEYEGKAKPPKYLMRLKRLEQKINAMTEIVAGMHRKF